MKAALVALALCGLALGIHAVDTSSYIFDTAQAIEKAAEQEISRVLNLVDSKKGQDAGLEGMLTKKDEPVPIRVAARYIVSPDEAKAFVEIFEKQKDSALKQEGTESYRLFKTLDDNVTFLFAGVWKSYEDLKDHLESKDTLEFLKELAERRIFFKTTQVIEIARGGDRHD